MCVEFGLQLEHIVALARGTCGIWVELRLLSPQRRENVGLISKNCKCVFDIWTAVLLPVVMINLVLIHASLGVRREHYLEMVPVTDSQPFS